MKIFSGSANVPLAEKIVHILDIKLAPRELFVFPDGERRVQIQEHVVDEDTIVVQPTAAPVDSNYMELFFLCDGLKRSGAKSVTAVIPYLGYQRQDHVFREGEAVSLDVIVKTLEAIGVDRVISFDLHSIKIPEFFTVQMIQLSALPLFAEVIAKTINPSQPPLIRGGASSSPPDKGELEGVHSLLVSPDMGGLRRIKQLSELLDGMQWIATVKDRDLATGDIVIETIEGEIPTGVQQAFIVDDMISSGKTMVEAANLLQKKGIEKIFIFTTHAVLSQEAPALLEQSIIEKVFVTDTVYIPDEKVFPKLQILSIGEVVADVLKNDT